MRRRRLARTARWAVLLTACLALPVSGAADARKRNPDRPPARPFAASSYLNTPLAPGAALDPRSGLMVRQILSAVSAHGASVTYSCYASPVWTVKRSQRRVTVTPDQRNPSLASQWAKVPLPGAARAACGEDGHLTVWQPGTDTLWEFYRFRRDASGHPIATYGGRMQHVSRNPGYFTNPPGNGFGATATSIPLLAGMQRVREIQRGRIDHALAFAMPGPAPCYRWPAQRRDSGTSGANLLAPPEGARLRLPASLDLKRLGLTPYGLTVARAVQRYGMVLRDTSGTPTLFAEATHDGQRGPYQQIFGSEFPTQRTVLRNFPWAQLQVLAPRAGDGGCSGLPGGLSLPPLL